MTTTTQNRQIAKWDKLAHEADPARAALWTPESQAARFAQALKYADPQPGESILDWGCGQAALADRLLPDAYDYVGVDWSHEMLAAAVRRVGIGNGRFYLPDAYNGVADVVFALGTWNLRLDWTTHDTGAQLSHLFTRHTRRILVASFYTGNDPECLWYHAADLAASADALTPRWTLERWRDNDVMMVLTK